MSLGGVARRAHLYIGFSTGRGFLSTRPCEGNSGGRDGWGTRERGLFGVRTRRFRAFVRGAMSDRRWSLSPCAQVSPESCACGWSPSQRSGLATIDGRPLAHFAVRGADGKWFPASAHIDGNAVLAGSPNVTSPVAVRYAWADSPECNLMNGVGLPASPFRMEIASR